MDETNRKIFEDMAPAFYEIKFTSQLDERWSDWFDGMELSILEDGCTLLQGPVPDQAYLHGVLDKIRNLNLKLISVTRIDHS